MRLTRLLRVQNVGLLSLAALLTGIMTPTPASAWSGVDGTNTRSLAGSYLAGRFARSSHDTGQAANVLSQCPAPGPR